MRFVPWSEVGTITVSPGDNVVEVGAFELAEGADTLWVRMTNTGTPGPWPWSYGILSFKTDEGQPLGSIKAYNSYEGEVFRLGVGLTPSVRAGVLTFEPRGFNMAWIKQGNPWSLKFEAQSGGGLVNNLFWQRDSENGLITPKTSGDNLDMSPGWIKAKNLILADSDGGNEDHSVAGFQSGSWIPLVGASDGNSTHSYEINKGAFSRVGNLVTISFHTLIKALGNNGTGQAGIARLPYPVRTGFGWSGVLGFAQNFDANFNPVVLQERDAGSFIFRRYEQGGGSVNIGVGRFTDTTYVQGTVTYQTTNSDWKPENGANVDP